MTEEPMSNYKVSISDHVARSYKIVQPELRFAIKIVY